MNILYATDEDGLWLYELSRAVLKKAIPDANVILFTDFDGSSEDATVVNVSKYLSDTGIRSLWSGRYRFPPMSAARLVAPLVPETKALDRILYLDTDTIVLDADAVRKFYGTEFADDADCIGVRDDCHPLYLSRDNRRLQKLRDSVTESHALDGHLDVLDRNLGNGLYVNTGVVLYNMGAMSVWYEEKIGLIRSVMEKHQFRFVDQDLTNMVLRTQEAEPKFNDLVAGHGMIPFYDTAIAHYAGGRSAKDAFTEKAVKLLDLPLL